MNDNHVCDRCGKPLDRVNWWTASIHDRFGAIKWKLCVACAVIVEEAIRKAVKR